jgi:hypothetical protein
MIGTPSPRLQRLAIQVQQDLQQRGIDAAIWDARTVRQAMANVLGEHENEGTLDHWLARTLQPPLQDAIVGALRNVVPQGALDRQQRRLERRQQR